MSTVTFSATLNVDIAGSATLPIVELDRAQVEKPRAHIRPLPEKQDTLKFSAWSLYQAIKKAELATAFSQADIDHSAACFAAEHHRLFRWNNEECRLAVGVIDMFEIGGRSNRAKLIGEGMLLLVMQKKSYAYWDRFDLLVKRALRHETLRHPKSTRRARIVKKRLRTLGSGKRCDFVVENSHNETALAEAKGGFVSIGDVPAIKTDLKDALTQLAVSRQLILPQPRKTYAVGTYLREEDDPANEGSLIAVVDPEEPGQTNESVELPEDWIRRGNYGAWLIGMGFERSGNALRSGTPRQPESVTLPIKRVGGREYAFVVNGLTIDEPVSTRVARALRRHGPHCFERLFFGPWPRWARLDIIGIRADVIPTITRSFVVPHERALMTIEPHFEPDLGQFDGSVMPDGSLVGAITVESLRESDFREFEL